jgi:hypothetical protein
MKEVLDTALERLSGFGTETGTGNPNHGPMAVQALVELGFAEAVAPWVTEYAGRLTAAPAAVTPISEETWRTALGAKHRFADWQLFFRRELDQMSWRDLLSTWLPRLWPGGMAEGGHGPIRVAHAVSAMSSEATEPRLDELVSALAYWAAYYRELSSTASLEGDMDVRSALQHLPHLNETQQRSGVPPQVLRLLGGVPEFTHALDLLAAPTEPLEQLHDLSWAGADLYRRNNSRFPLVFAHTITTTEAVRILLPCTPESAHTDAYRFGWHYTAATWAAFGTSGAAAAPPIDRVPEIDEVLDHCLASGDEHAFKLTAACLHEYRRTGDPIFLSVADDWSTQMLGAREWDLNRRIAAGLAFV